MVACAVLTQSFLSIPEDELRRVLLRVPAKNAQRRHALARFVRPTQGGSAPLSILIDKLEVSFAPCS